MLDKGNRLTAAYEKVAKLEGLEGQREFNLTAQLALQNTDGSLDPGPFSTEQITSMVRPSHHPRLVDETALMPAGLAALMYLSLPTSLHSLTN